MAVEVANLVAGLCRVRIPVPVGTPSFFAATKQNSNVGFAVFVATPAPAANSERLSAGIYRMHMPQTLSGANGQIAVWPGLNASAAQEAAMDPFPPGINATPVDLGSGTDIVVTVGGGPPNGASSPIDGDFSLLVLQFPTTLA